MINLFDIINGPLYIKKYNRVCECRIVELTFGCSGFISNNGVIDISKSPIRDFTIEYADINGETKRLSLDNIMIRLIINGIYDNVADCYQNNINNSVLSLKNGIFLKYLVYNNSKHIVIDKILDITSLTNCFWEKYRGNLRERLIEKFTNKQRQCIRAYMWNGKEIIKCEINNYMFIYDAMTKEIKVDSHFIGNGGYYSSEEECRKDLIKKGILSEDETETIKVIHFNNK